jgi:hypothetical protein
MTQQCLVHFLLTPESSAEVFFYPFPPIQKNMIALFTARWPCAATARVTHRGEADGHGSHFDEEVLKVLLSVLLRVLEWRRGKGGQMKFFFFCGGGSSAIPIGGHLDPLS